MKDHEIFDPSEWWGSLEKSALNWEDVSAGLSYGKGQLKAQSENLLKGIKDPDLYKKYAVPLATGGLSALAGAVATGGRRSARGESHLGYLFRLLRNSAVAGTLGGIGGFALDRGVGSATGTTLSDRALKSLGIEVPGDGEDEKPKTNAEKIVAAVKGEGGADIGPWTVASSGLLTVGGLNALGSGKAKAKSQALAESRIRQGVLESNNMTRVVSRDVKKSRKAVGKSKDLRATLNAPNSVAELSIKNALQANPKLKKDLLRLGIDRYSNSGAFGKSWNKGVKPAARALAFGHSGANRGRAVTRTLGIPLLFAASPSVVRNTKEWLNSTDSIFTGLGHTWDKSVDAVSPVTNKILAAAEAAKGWRPSGG